MFAPKRTLKSVMQELEQGLRNGTIVLQRSETEVGANGEKKCSTDDEPNWVPAASFGQGPYYSYVRDPAALNPRPQHKRVSRAADHVTWVMVAPGGPRDEVLRHAFV